MLIRGRENLNLPDNLNNIGADDSIFDNDQMTKKLRRKTNGHWSELFPTELFDLPDPLPRVESLVEDGFGSTQYNEFLIIAKYQILDIMTETKKRVVAQYDFRDPTKPTYKAVLLCLHEATDLAIIFELPNIKFETIYALDQYQSTLVEKYFYLAPRSRAIRKIDAILQDENQHYLLPKAMQKPSQVVQRLIDNYHGRRSKLLSNKKKMIDKDE